MHAYRQHGCTCWSAFFLAAEPFCNLSLELMTMHAWRYKSSQTFKPPCRFLERDQQGLK